MKGAPKTIPPIEKIATVTSEQSNKLLQLQRNILEMVALGKDHQQTLNNLCIATEQMLPNSVSSIMVYNDSQTHFEVLTGPSLPEAAIKALNGLIPGDGNGSCSTAVYSNEPQYVCQLDTDPRWKNVRQFALDFNICACWSMPIRIFDRESIGSFALSSFEKRQPSEFHKQLLETSAYIAGIILKRQKEEKQLWDLAHHDPLTQLPNRLLFNLRFEHAIEHAHRDSLKLGLIPPRDFISFAEETGLISNLGYWVINSACSQYKVWLNNGLTLPHI